MLREERTMNFKNQLEQWKKPANPRLPSHVVHAMFMGRTVYLPTFIWLMFMVNVGTYTSINHINVGKYTSPMDPIGGDYFINHYKDPVMKPPTWLNWSDQMILRRKKQTQTFGTSRIKGFLAPSQNCQALEHTLLGTVPYPLPRAVWKIIVLFPR